MNYECTLHFPECNYVFVSRYKSIKIFSHLAFWTTFFTFFHYQFSIINYFVHFEYLFFSLILNSKFSTLEECKPVFVSLYKSIMIFSFCTLLHTFLAFFSIFSNMKMVNISRNISKNQTLETTPWVVSTISVTFQW